MDRLLTLGILGGVIVSTLAWNAKDVGLIPTLGTIFPIFIIPTTITQLRISIRHKYKRCN